MTQSTSGGHSTAVLNENPTAVTMQSTSGGHSTAVINENLTIVTTQSTTNGSSTITSTVTSFPTSSNDDTSSTTLFITIGVLSVLLIGSITATIFCTVSYTYRWKRQERYGVGWLMYK